MPASIKAGGALTTQPMAVPRPGSGGLKPARANAAQSTRSTQRIVLPTPPGARAANTRSLASASANGRINLPMGMILRCLPPEVLASELSEFEATGAAATEIGLPMNMILSQLPSGKVEMTLQELIPHFPPGFLQPTEAIGSYLPQMVSLPLMDVVMRIPPDLLALRPDQKDVDASVINMADPFTEEILREQAEAARRQTQPNIIEESQAPQEEFVPRDQAPAFKSVAPPRRPTVDPLSPNRTAATTLGAPPMPPAAKLPTPPAPVGPRASQMIPKPTATPVRSFAPTTEIPHPARPSGPLPTPTPAPASPSASQSIAPVPPVPRHTGPIPAPPPPRHTTSLPKPSAFSSQPPATESSQAAPAPETAPSVDEKAGETSLAVTPGAPDASADDLQRLAALAMAQLGEASEDESESLIVTKAPPTPEPEATPSAPAVETTPAPSFTPPSTRQPIPAPSPAVAPEPVLSSTSAPATEEQAAAPAAVAFNLNTCTVEDLVENIPGCTAILGAAIVSHRNKIGSFKRIEELLEVPGMTKDAYTNLTGEPPPGNRIAQTLNELLNFPESQNVTLKDVTERIACWPDVSGCLLSQGNGLSLVGTTPPGVDKNAVVAFVPRMFEAINKSFGEVSGQDTDAILIPSAGTSFHLFRSEDLYLIIMSRLPQMPERHMKVARLVLAALSSRRD